MVQTYKHGINGSHTIPFTAFIGQEELKLALILLAINPKISGLLIRGEKGTGKSTIVRALAELLPSIEVVADCPFNCDPNDPSSMCETCRARYFSGEKLPVKTVKMRVVTLPIGATEDMVVGTLDIERALSEGIKALQPGILARANRNILYIDEVNLLPDNIVDVILDAAASGWNFVEREGVSVSHPARFILVGTMNPEEGELRPQLLDRFAISVEARTLMDEELRVGIIRLFEEFNADPNNVYLRYKKFQDDLRRRIISARERLKNIRVSERMFRIAAKICSELDVDGHRPDIIILEVARTLASFFGRDEVVEEDIKNAAFYALSHRTRSGGRMLPPTTKEIEKAFEKAVKKIKKDADKIKKEKLPKKEGKRKVTEGGLSDKYLLAKKTKYKEVKKEMKSDLKRKPKDRIVSKIAYVASSFAKKLRIKSVIGGKSREKVKKQGLYKGPNVNGEINPLPFGDKRDTKKIVDKGIFPYALPSLFAPPIMVDRKKQTTLRVLRRVLRGRRALFLTRSSQGIYINYESPKGSLEDIALYPTIVSAILRGSFEKQGRIKPTKQDIRVKIKASRARCLIVIVLDVSYSMKRYIKGLAKTLEKIYNIAWRKKDKVALIACGGENAKVVHYPTNNIKIIANSITKLKLGGRTPLADGFLKALKIVKLERLKNPGIIPIILIMSDGLANIPLSRPLNPILREEMASDAQADLLSVAQLARKNNIGIVVLNTFDTKETLIEAKILSPTLLLKLVSRICNGVYIGIQAIEDKIARIKIPAMIPDQALAVIIDRAITEAIQKIAQKRY